MIDLISAAGRHDLHVMAAFGLVFVALAAELLLLRSRRRALARANEGEAEDSSDEIQG
jgi:hypothetical protein